MAVVDEVEAEADSLPMAKEEDVVAIYRTISQYMTGQKVSKYLAFAPTLIQS